MKTTKLYLLLITLISNSAALADSVPVPGDIQEKTAGITVTGEAGPGQGKNFAAVRLQLEGSRVLPGWQTKADMRRSPLGQELTVPAGRYLLLYYGYNVIDIAP